MTTQQVANRLVELCRTGNYEQVVSELYAPEITSIEPVGVPNRVAKGLPAIMKKGKAFESKIEKVNRSIVTDPIVAENYFSCAMLMNVHMKDVPVPIDMDEICVYSVSEGKITSEQFFYTPQSSKGK